MKKLLISLILVGSIFFLYACNEVNEKNIQPISLIAFEEWAHVQLDEDFVRNEIQNFLNHSNFTQELDDEWKNLFIRSIHIPSVNIKSQIEIADEDEWNSDFNIIEVISYIPASSEPVPFGGPFIQFVSPGVFSFLVNYEPVIEEFDFYEGEWILDLSPRIYTVEILLNDEGKLYRGSVISPNVINHMFKPNMDPIFEMIVDFLE